VRADTEYSLLLSAREHRRLVSLLRLVVLPHFDPPPPADLVDRTGFLVAHARLRFEAAADARLSPLGLTVRTFVALAILDSRGPCSQQDLAGELDIGPAATVELVDELERLGIVRRTRNTIDRRSYALELTADGQPMLRRAKEAAHAATSELMAMLSEAERSELADLLAKLAGVNVERFAPDIGSSRRPADQTRLHGAQRHEPVAETRIL